MSIIGAVETETAIANGDTRTLSFYNPHTQENITATFKQDGRYDPVVLDKLNWYLRDWRKDEPTHMDPRLFDATWETYRESGSQQPIEVVSAYRSPGTNAMLRRRSRAVAETSQHMAGKAMDLHFPDVAVSRIRDIAMRLQRGGVGYYPTGITPWVHIDVGSVRYWPRMGYDAMARIFPDGKTVYIPSNGKPMARYEEAKAEIEARGSAIDPSERPSSGGVFAWLFGGGGKKRHEDDDNAVITRGRGPARTVVASNAPVAAPAPIGALPAAPVAVATPALPMPPRRPSDFAALAAQLSPPVPTPPARPVELAALVPPTPPRNAPATQQAAVAAFFAHASANLPAVITRGPQGAEPGTAPAEVLAYAALPAAPQPRVAAVRTAASATPSPTGLRLPAPRVAAAVRKADFVLARLDRSNFHGLVSPADLSHTVIQTAFGSSMQPVRAAARLDIMAMAMAPTATLPARFGSSATALPTARFNEGPAVVALRPATDATGLVASN